MIPVRRPRTRVLLLSIALGWGAVCGGLAQVPNPPREASDPGPALPPGIEIEFQGTATQSEDGVMFTGPVTLKSNETLIQADQLLLRDRRYIEAQGNVLIVWGRNRVFGSRLSYDLEEERGTIEEAIGYALDEYLIHAESIEKIGEFKLLLRKATVTTCNQPLPYWSFAVTSATMTLEKYVRMRNVRLRVKRVPFFYLPYLVWPVKDGRAAGLLMPEFHTTQDRGDVIAQQLFLPLGRSADVTLEGRWYSKAGFGGGGLVRFIPNLKGQGFFNGFYIADEVAGKDRYRMDYRQTQEFHNGFRMVADIGAVSDAEYYVDFERDLNVASQPQSLARLEFSRNGKWASLNVRELRDEQLSSGLVQQSLPEIELRGRSRRMGRTPFYLAFESSLASIQQRLDTAFFSADYLRGDVAPVLTMPWSPFPWVDITPRVSYRYTYYTQHLEDGVVQDSPLSRQLWSYDIQIDGPKLFRTFGEADGRARFKHAIEPRIQYGFGEPFDRSGDVLSFDEVDRAGGAGNVLAYALVQRLLARRPQRVPLVSPVASDTIILPDGTVDEPTDSPEDAGSPAVKPPSIPVEIASLEIGQRRSFDEDLSRADFDGDGVVDATSPYSSVVLTGRVNPSQALSLDLRSGYDILFDEVSDVSLSGSVRGPMLSTKFSLVHRNGLGENAEDSTQVRLLGGVRLLQDRLWFNAEVSYNANPSVGGTHFPEQHFQFVYSTQCCSFYVERLTRDFGTAPTRRELYFRLDLRGVGKLLQKTF